MWRVWVFLTLTVAVVVAAWFLRPNPVWDLQYLWLPVASLLGVLIKETSPDLPPPAPRPAGLPPPRLPWADHADPVPLAAAEVGAALRRLRRSVIVQIVKLAVVVAAVLVVAVGVAVGVAVFGWEGTASDAAEVRTSPRVEVVVVSSDRANPAAAWSASDVEVRLPDGRLLWLRNNGDHRWEPGTHLQVVVDPDGDGVLSVADHAAADRWIDVGLGAIAAGLAGLVGWLVLSGSRLPPRVWHRALRVRPVGGVHGRGRPAPVGPRHCFVGGDR